jgi:hypothetical protein
MKTPRSRSSAADLELPKRRVKIQPSAVALWRPEIVLASSISGATAPR